MTVRHLAMSGAGRWGLADRPPQARRRLTLPGPRWRQVFDGDDGKVWLPAFALAGAITGWAIAAVLFHEARVEIDAPRAHIGIEASAAAVRLFCGVVLFLFAAEGRGRHRLRWAAGGFVVLGLGGGVFGFLLPVLGRPQDAEAAAYGSYVVATVAGILFVVGFVPRSPPAFTSRSLRLSVAAAAVPSAVVVLASDWLPAMSRGAGSAAAAGALGWDALTAAHWVMVLVPFALLAVAAGGAVTRASAADGLRAWLVLAIVVMAGAQLHNVVWPSVYEPILSGANLLRFASAAMVAVAGLIELRRAAAQRAGLLATEQAHAKRLRELAELKADFTAMVAHELVSPIAAIRGLADMLATDELDQEHRAQVVATIRAEASSLDALVADVRLSARSERQDFSIAPIPVAVDLVLADAVAVAKTLPGDHPIVCEFVRRERVLVDPERIHQVLRNLLSNAAKYSPPGAPIEIRARRQGERVRVEVVDRGYGIHPGDLARVFQKFGRGRDAVGRRVQGVGLGLYLSRRIVQLHGSELTVTSTYGVGSSFGFELEVVR